MPLCLAVLVGPWARAEHNHVLDRTTNPGADQEVQVVDTAEQLEIFDGLLALGEIDPKRDAIGFLKASLGRASDLFKEAVGHYLHSKQNQHAKVLRGVRETLDRSTLLMPRDGTNFKHCVDKPSVLAFVYLGSPEVYVCLRALSGEFVETGMAQILIHEAAHVHGMGDECDATSVEIATMTKTSAGLQFKNGYWKQCGFES